MHQEDHRGESDVLFSCSLKSIKSFRADLFFLFNNVNIVQICKKMGDSTVLCFSFP